ncbi:MAG: hypothetical protein M0C28_17245 [Candidatus Moduliflexus flocculans]|nr:hypothetical protein [Candidatus Moduliflexus flocculans]
MPSTLPRFSSSIPLVIEDLTCTIYGIVEPGSANVTIMSILWDWGDGQTPEYHGFPNSHTYSSPGVLHPLDHRPAVRRAEGHWQPRRFLWGSRSSRYTRSRNARLQPGGPGDPSW